MSAIKSLASLVTTKQDRKTALASLIEFNSDGDLIVERGRAFQYYPETITDSRDIDYKSKDVAGGSHPIMQWVNSGARKISFEATFSNEEAPPFTGDGGLSGFAQQIQNVGATISGIAKNPVSAAIGAIKGKDSSARWSVDVASAIAWLRSMTYPEYADNQRSGVVSAPPKLLLVLPNSGITSGVGGQSASVQSGTVPVIMTQCDVTYEAFFRSGHPRIVTVSLAFIETLQIGKSWSFVGRGRVFGDKAQHSYNTYTLQDRSFSAQDSGYRSSGNTTLSKIGNGLKKFVG